MNEITVRPAGPRDLDRLAALFNAYRVYYRQHSDLQRARDFLSARIDGDESVILLASLHLA